MSENDQSKEILEKLLSDLYAQQTSNLSDRGRSYLLGQDAQFLGRISSNAFDKNSILNQYGPYGSPYSKSSIFNEYSPYGSPYGQYSINNPYCSTPPELYINDKKIGVVTKNKILPDGIPTEGFMYTLKNNISGLLRGSIEWSESNVRMYRGESFLLSDDGTFLGSLRPNRMDHDSIFSQFGAYGSKFSQTSIYNKFGPYGGRYSNLSPYNPYSINPPKIYHKGKFYAFLTTNKAKTPRVDPDEIKTWADRNVRR